MSAPSGFVSSAPALHTGHAARTSPSTCSTFAGRHLQKSVVPPSRVAPLERCQVTMKKGRLPKHMMPQQPQRQQNVPLPEDGTPVFALFVRTPRTKIWYPLGGVKGDNRSKNLANALKGGIARGMYQNALDRGMAQTLYGKDSNRFLQNAIRLYPQLKKFTKELEYGYKMSAVGMEEQKTRVVSKEMAKPFFAKVQQNVGNFINKFTGK